MGVQEGGKEMSEFNAWFVEQHGKRKTIKKTDDELSELIAAGKEAERELAFRILWDEKRLSASYAWTAQQLSGRK